MADVIPATTFFVTLTEKEYNLVMLALAIIAGADAKPDGHHRRAAAVLNQQLLRTEARTFRERTAAVEKKLEKAPAVPPAEEEAS